LCLKHRPDFNFNENYFESKESFTFCFELKNGSVADSRFSWVKPNKEFMFEDVLYDVKNIDSTDKYITIKCYSDIKETKILCSLKLKKNNTSASHTESPKINVSISLLVIALNNQLVLETLTSKDSDFIYVNKFKTIDYQSVLESPPDFSI
jgi:hypothetical protein